MQTDRQAPPGIGWLGHQKYTTIPQENMKIKEEEKIVTVRSEEPDIKLNILYCMQKLCEGKLQ